MLNDNKSFSISCHQLQLLLRLKSSDVFTVCRGRPTSLWQLSVESEESLTDRQTVGLGWAEEADKETIDL